MMNFSQPFPQERMTPELEHYKKFLEDHFSQLSRIEFPRDLYNKLYEKLRGDVRDAGESFLFDTSAKHSMNPKLSPLVAIKDIKKEDDVFIVDHIYSTMERDMERQIEKIEKLRELCVELMHLDLDLESGKKKLDTIEKKESSEDRSIESTESNESPVESSNENQTQTTTHSTENLKKEIITIECVGGKLLKIRGGAKVIQEESFDFKDVIAIDLQYNNLIDLSSIESLASKINNQILSIDLRWNVIAFDNNDLKKLFPNAQIINGQLLDTYTEWAFNFLSNVDRVENIISLSLDYADIKVWKEEEFKKLSNCTSLSLKGNVITDEALNALQTIPKLREIFTNWEYHRLVHNKKIPQLKKANRVYLNTFEIAKENKLAAMYIKDNIWKFFETYTIQSITYDPIWYLMDSVGLAIDNGSRFPNFKIAPFQFVDKEEFITLIWPITDVKKGEKITRDYTFGGASNVFRLINNLIWHPEKELPEGSNDSKAVGGEFVNPKKKSAFDQKPKPIEKFNKKIIKVCCDSRLVRESILTEHAKKNKDAPEYDLVGEFSEADILWIVHDHYTNPMEKLPEKQFINQFQHDHNLTSKPYFTKNSKGKPWDIQSYFLGDEEQTYNFVKEYYRRKKAGEHNVWIAKPSNLTRSQAIIVSDNLAAILKWMSTPGDLVVSIYLEKPALYRKRKFDLRFILLVDSIYPTVKLYLYDQFKVRLASEDYELNDLSSFKKHFTVQQYVNGPQADIPCTMFKREWNLEHPDTPFEDLYQKICVNIRAMIENVKEMISDDNHLASPHCKAIYGVDVIIDNSTGEFIPKILECNFSPDATYFQNLKGRNFYREVFDTLFTTQPIPKTIVEI